MLLLVNDVRSSVSAGSFWWGNRCSGAPPIVSVDVLFAKWALAADTLIDDWFETGILQPRIKRENLFASGSVVFKNHPVRIQIRSQSFQAGTSSSAVLLSPTSGPHPSGLGNVTTQMCWQ
jgi:hypothetical protein